MGYFDSVAGTLADIWAERDGKYYITGIYWTREEATAYIVSMGGEVKGDRWRRKTGEWMKFEPELKYETSAEGEDE